MNRLNPILIALLLASLPGTAHALCATNICSAELPNDTDSFETVGRISVLLKNAPSWKNAYSRVAGQVDPFEGSCECKDAQAAALQENLKTKFAQLRPQYDYYNVECFIVPAGESSRAWTYQGRFQAIDTSKTYAEWGRFYCGNNSYRFKSDTDFLEARYELASAFMNDADNDGIGGDDDHCDNGVASAYGWDAHRSGTLRTDEEAGDQRGCFEPKAWPAPDTDGMSILKRCTVTITARPDQEDARQSIVTMSSLAPSLVLQDGQELKAAAETILKLQFMSQGNVYATCADGRVIGPFASQIHGRDYAAWEAAGACGGLMATAKIDFHPRVSEPATQLTCSIENDADGDGVANEADHCPLSPSGSAVFPESFENEDQRGCPADCGAGKEYRNNRCELQCPQSSARDAVTGQCQCADGTLFDASAGNICEDKDEDKDGILWPLDQCPQSAIPSIVDAKGCELDSDADGVPDRLDRCPLTPKGTLIDRLGCGVDTDADGLEDSLEYQDAQIDCRQSLVLNADGARDMSLYRQIIRDASIYGGRYLGCLRSEVDTDRDGVANERDLCPATPENEAASLSCAAGSKICGCSVSEQDQDADGVRNADDLCPASKGPPANQGCAAEDMNAAPESDLCPVPSLKSVSEAYFREMVQRGQASSCPAPIAVIDSSGTNYGSVCEGTEGYAAYQLEKNFNAVAVKDPALHARAGCYLRSHEGASLRSEYIAPLFQEHQVIVWANRELLQKLSGSSAYACQALLNDYNVHAVAYHGMMQAPRAKLAGEETGERLEIWNAGPLDVEAESACGLTRPNVSQDPTHFLKLYP